MADNILKLRVDSAEYDAKLKKAAEGIRHLADVAHQSGGELTGLEKAELDYVKALGEMETKSRTAAGSVRELESTYKELKVIYDQLNDVEKADEGGKALAASLEQIKTRAQEARTQLENASKSLSDNGQEAQQSSSALDALASKFTINIDAIKLFNIGLNAAKGALDVAKDAFMSSEANVDEWGRVMDSSKSLYEGFLTALNTGDISGYLNNIDSIVQAARTAYNELDRLGTMKTIQAPQMSAQQTENERIRSMIQTGRYIAPIDGRRNAVFNGREMQSGDKLTAGQIRALEKQLQNGMQKVVTLVGNEVKQTSKAIDAVYNRQAQELGMGIDEFRKGTSSMAEFDKRMAGYDQYQKWRNENYYTDNWGNRRVKEGNPFEEYKKWGTFRVDGERYNDLVRLIQQRDQQAGQAYGMQSQAYRTMNRAEGFTVSKLMGGANGGKGTDTNKEQTELQQNQAKINTLTQEYVKLGNDGTEASKKRQTEIRKEIDLLQQRNGLLGLRAEQAQGRMLSNDDIKRKAEIDIQVNTKQIEDLRRQLAEIEKTTATVNVDATNSPDFLSFSKGMPKPRKAGGRDISTKSVTITATDEALPKLREIEGITIDDKTMTVTAETSDALRALHGIEGVTIDPKSVTITAADEALPKLREIEGITINDKTMTVTAETADALRALQGIEGVTIEPKTIEVNANTSEAQQKIDELKAKIAELEDKNINIKAFVDNIGRPLDEQQLNNNPGTLLKTPETDIPRGGLLLDDKDMKAVRKNIDDSLPKAEKKESPMEGSKKMLNAISQLTGGLQQMGIELPSEIQGVIGVIQGAMQVIEAVNTIIGVTQTTALTANTAAMVSLEAALWANTSTSWIPLLANGGVVPGFANGGVIDSGHSPSFLSFSKAAPAFATGGVVPQTIASIPKFATGGIIQKFNDGGTVEAEHAPDFLSFSKAMPKFATGGVVSQVTIPMPKFATGGIIQKFNEGGTVEAGHAPDFLSFSKSMPKFATGGTIQKFNEGGTVEAGHAPDFLSFSKAMPKRFASGGTIPHANSGYFVGGTHFSGDVTPIMANAGELVLNKAQQFNLASQLQGGGMQGLNLTATIKGEQIRLALNNNGRRTGRGEYVQSNKR